MTDKEIIINDVDVSKCIHIDDWKHCNCCNDLIKTIYPKASQCLIEEDLRCEIYPNCYFKQLKRKEQECEELKKEISGYKTIIGKIRQEVQEDVTCESRECGCDSYEECIKCLKNTILNIIYEERNDFVQGRVICKECGK